ncbi:unnamed protein product, partial [Prorocentrum cordatum]
MRGPAQCGPDAIPRRCGRDLIRFRDSMQPTLGRSMSFEGVSRDSIISIRAGSVRRQAPLSSIDKPFKFPCTPEDCGSIKVDVFDHVGSARGFISGGQRDYQLRCEPRGSQGAGERAAGGAAQGMQVSFAVRPTGQAAKG